MEAQAWTAIVFLAAYLISFVHFMGRAIDRFEARLDSRIDELEATIDYHS